MLQIHTAHITHPPYYYIKIKAFNTIAFLGYHILLHVASRIHNNNNISTIHVTVSHECLWCVCNDDISWNHISIKSYTFEGIWCSNTVEPLNKGRFGTSNSSTFLNREVSSFQRLKLHQTYSLGQEILSLVQSFMYYILNTGSPLSEVPLYIHIVLSTEQLLNC